jgi:PAS domain S-box-containing protein
MKGHNKAGKTTRNVADAARDASLYHALFDTTPDAAILFGGDNAVCVAVNDSFLRYSGYSRERFIGVPLAELPCWTNLDVHRTLLQLTLDKGQFDPVATEVLLKDGTIGHAVVSGRALDLEDGSFTVWLIHPRMNYQHVEDVPRIEVGEMEHIFDISLDLVVIMDAQSRIYRANREWEHVLGFDPAQLRGQRFQDWVHPDDYEPGMTVLKALASGQSIVGYLNRIRHKNGTYRWIEWRAAPYRDALIFATARDLTERIAAEDILRENSFLLSESQRVAQLGSYVYELNSGRWTSSAMLDNIFGIGQDFDRTTGGWSGLIHTDDRDETVLLFSETMHRATRFNHEYRIVRASDGEIRWVHGLGEVIADDGGTPVKLIGVIQDITDRKRADAAINEATQRRQALFEQARDAILIVQAQDGTILEVNSEVERLLGRPRTELIGRSVGVIHPPENLEQLVNHFRNTMRGGSQNMFEGELMAADGHRIPVEISASLIELSDGRSVVQGFVRDITERKRAEEAVRQGDERFRIAFQTSPDSAAIIRLRDGVYVDINDTFAAVTGYRWDEVIGLSSPELGLYADPEDRNRILAVLHEDGVLRNYEVVLRMKNGSLRTGLVSARVLDLNGELYILTIARDITEQKVVDIELRRSREQLRRLTQHIETTREEERKWIAREIHDELGQLLTALKLDLSWMKKRLPPESGELMDKASGMNALVESAMQSIKRILFQLRPVPLGDVGFEAALEWLVQDMRSRTGLECEARMNIVSDRLDPARTTAIFRILQEALNNVVRHARATKVLIELTGDANRIVLRVDDNGVGVSSADEHKVKSFGIIGMRERARFYGGEVDIQKKVEGGTVVIATIPTKEGSPDGSNSNR